MKDKLGGKIMKEFILIRPKKHSYLTDHKDENKKREDKKYTKGFCKNKT